MENEELGVWKGELENENGKLKMENHNSLMRF